MSLVAEIYGDGVLRIATCRRLVVDIAGFNGYGPLELRQRQQLQ